MSDRTFNFMGMPLERPTTVQITTTVTGVALVFAIAMLTGAIPGSLMPAELIPGTFLMSILLVGLVRAGMDVAQHPMQTVVCVGACISISSTVALLINAIVLGVSP